MSDLRKAAEIALDALEEINKLSIGKNAICLPAEIDDAMDALRAALAKPTPLTSEEMSQWVKTTWKQCQDKAWEESHE